MKVPLNFIRNLQNFELPAVEGIVDKVGAQLGAVDEVIEVGAKYENIYVVKVVACEKHPDADKLSVCKIDDNRQAKDVTRDHDGLVQVVCGAPNVHADMLAVWIPPGVTVPETADKEPFVLEAREIRGIVSNGMLASPKELAFGDSHEGILEVEGDFKAGTSLGLDNEFVLDIENKMFTHRPDCFGILGVAREVSGIFHQPFKNPDWFVSRPEFPKFVGDPSPLGVKNEVTELVPRFTAITMKNVKVGPSPLWLKIALAELGQKSINNIVDYTNWFMLFSGQPLHAYDYDKVKALSGGEPTLVVRNPRPGEKIKLLNGKEIEPRAEAIMIATDQQLIGIGGVMGGAETEVDENTTEIILEAATFDMYSVRRTSMAHGLFTDAATRFTKGQSPLQNLAVLARIVDEIINAGAGELSGSVIDSNHLDPVVMERESLHLPVKVTADFINVRLGLELKANEMKKFLENVEFEVAVSGDELTIKAPFWRTDIELREDIVEEIGRLYGYDHLPLNLPNRTLEPTPKDPLFEAKALIRNRLAKAGANELLTYSFVHGDLLQKVGQSPDAAYEISNALSPDLQHYRISLLPSLLEKVHPNIKAGFEEFTLFEIGKTHSTLHGTDEAGLPKEYEFTALVVTAADKLKKPGAAYYQAQKYLNQLAGVELEFKPVSKDMQDYQVVQLYDLNRTALVRVKGGDFCGIIGEFKPSVARNLKLPNYTAGFEVDTTVLQKVLQAGPQYHPLSRFPSVKQDITLRAPVDVPHAELRDFIADQLAQAKPADAGAELNDFDIYQRPDDPKHKQVTFGVSVTAYDRTLTDKSVNELLDTIADAAKAKFKAERI
jgi:phenylalanyl-tRNA synthetase beta chain